MRSSAVLMFLAVVVVGLGALFVATATDERDVAFTLGVAPGIVAAELPPGATVCQTPVAVAEPFDGLRFQVGTYHRPGPGLAVAVRRRSAGTPSVATGRLPGGYPDVSQPTVRLDRELRAGGRVDVCIRNRGVRRVALYGGPELAKRRSTAKVDGRDQRTDLTLLFTKEQESALAMTPAIFERASLFRPVWIGAWAYWLLAGLALLLAPTLLAWSLRQAFDGVKASAGDARPSGDRESRTQA